MTVCAYKSPRDVLRFWFEGDFDDPALNRIDFFRFKAKSLWYVGASVDSLCAPFADTIEAVASGALDNDMEWSGSDSSHPMSSIAKIVLFDQLSRNCFRGTPKAFVFDKQALDISKALCVDPVLTSVGAAAVHFITSPLMHSESLEDHDLALEVNSALAKRSPEIAKGNRGAFIEHRDVIVKFGRYPHRNAAMGRETTPEEKQWLESKSVPGWARSQ